jgi:predicted nucleic acid-binding protein
MKVYLDSCILIYRLEGPDPFSQPVDAAMHAAAGATFCITDLVRLECLVDPIRQNDEKRKAGFAIEFRKLTCLTIDRAVFDLAAELRAHHRLKTPDAIHAAAAITHGCEELWTNDRRLAALEQHLRLRALP